MNKPKITLNHPCPICKKEIILGEGTLIEKQPQHFSCYKKHIEDNLKKDVEKVIEDLCGFVEENKVTYDMGKSWCVMLDDDEKSEPLIPYIGKLKSRLGLE